MGKIKIVNRFVPTKIFFMDYFKDLSEIKDVSGIIYKTPFNIEKYNLNIKALSMALISAYATLPYTRDMLLKLVDNEGKEIKYKKSKYEKYKAKCITNRINLIDYYEPRLAYRIYFDWYRSSFNIKEFVKGDEVKTVEDLTRLYNIMLHLKNKSIKLYKDVTVYEKEDFFHIIDYYTYKIEKSDLDNVLVKLEKEFQFIDIFKLN